MFFRKKKKIVIQVDRIVYETRNHILLEYKGRNIWLRQARVQITQKADGSTAIELSERYFKAKDRDAGA